MQLVKSKPSLHYSLQFTIILDLVACRIALKAGTEISAESILLSLEVKLSKALRLDFTKRFSMRFSHREKC